MLSKSGYIKISYSDLTTTNIVNENLFEIFGYLFAKKLTQELKKGKISNYVLVEDSLSAVKGKISISKYMKDRIKGKSLICCRYDEFTSNNLMNQIFKRAVTILIKLVKNNKTLNLLRFCFMNLADVDDRHIAKEELDRVFFNRTNKRFYESFLLAKLIITGTSFDISVGFNDGISILFKMNDLFEKYIYYITNYVVMEEEVLEQDSRYKLLINESNDGEIFTLEPDIVIGDRLIIDTKWKKLSGSSKGYRVKRDDLYQMYAYLTRYKNVQSVILLYPHNKDIKHNSGECLESWHLHDNPDKKIQAYTVNYEDESECMEDIRNIIMEYRN